MSFDWHDYFKLADQLNSDPAVFGVDEAVFRCVASRAYYSAFCNARNTAIAKHHVTFGKFQVHQAVANHFFRRHSTLEKRISRNLSRLKKRRIQADYEDLIALPDTPTGIAQQALDLARRILADLQGVR